MISDKCENIDSITDMMMTSENNQMFKNESEKNSVKCYSCKACGNTFGANPPDDVHRFSSVYPCWKFDWIERSYECSRCSKNIKLFWHPEVHKHHDYATVEEIERKTSKNTLGNHPDYAQRMVGY
jgi:DNA-directed RNA polymerase subunit RPC12/RpoP